MSIEKALIAVDPNEVELEKEAGELTEALEAEETRGRELDALYKEKTAALDAHTMSKIRDTDIYQERLHDAFDAHRLASRETELHEKRSLRIRDVVSGFLAFVIFLLLGLGTLFYEQLPFTGTPFPLPQLPFVILFLAASGISFLVTLILLILKAALSMILLPFLMKVRQESIKRKAGRWLIFASSLAYRSIQEMAARPGKSCQSLLICCKTSGRII